MPKLGLSLVIAILASAISFRGPLAAPYSIDMSAQQQSHKPKAGKQPSGAQQRTIQQRSITRQPAQQRMIQQQRIQQPRFTHQPKVQQQTIQRRSVTQQPVLQQRTTQHRQMTEQPRFQQRGVQQSTVSRQRSLGQPKRFGHVQIRNASNVSVAGRNYSVWRGGHRVHRHGHWRTFVGLSALGAVAFGSAYYYPYAYIDAPAPYCDGLTEDGCQLQWEAVPTLEGPTEFVCVAYCPWR